MRSQTPTLSVEQAAAHLAAGSVVAFPTETVYGLGADATDERALREIFRLKGRPADHPLIVHLPDAAQLGRWARDVPEAARDLAERFWPGPLTLILKRQPWVLGVVTGGQETVGLRVPAHPLALRLLGRFGGALAAPSANRFGRISPTTAAHVGAEFAGAVPVLDGGPCRVGLESTILDLSTSAPRLLRPGAITAEALERALGEPVVRRVTGEPVAFAAGAAPRVPGGLASHYAPQTATLLVRDAAALSGEADAVLARRGAAAPAGRWLELPDNPQRYAQQLYAALRDLDAAGCARILIEAVPESPPWAAVRDRLQRAAIPADPAFAEKPASRGELG